MFKWIKERQKIKQEELELLRSIAKSLKALEGTIDNNRQYGGAIKTTSATRY